MALATIFASNLLAMDVAKYTKAQQLAAEAKHAEAATLYEEMLQTDSADPNIYFFYAQSLKALGKTDEAFRAYQKAAELEPKTSGYMDTVAFSFDYAKYCGAVNKIKECQTGFDRVLATIPTMKGNALLNNQYGLLELGMILAKVKEYNKAAQFFKTFERIVPDGLNSHDNDAYDVAITYAIAKQFDDAMRLLNILHSKYPNNLDVILTIVDIFIENRDTAKAQMYLDKALKIDPNNAMAKTIQKEIAVKKVK